MVALCPLSMRFLDYWLHVQKRQGCQRVYHKKKRVGLVLFSSGEHDIGSLREFFLLPSLSFLGITCVLFTYDMTWLLTAYERTTSEQAIPLDATRMKFLT